MSKIDEVLVGVTSLGFDTAPLIYFVERHPAYVDIVREFVEKPVTPSSNLAFSGIMVGSPALLDFVPRQIPADIGFHVLPTLAGRMAAYRISSYLLDIGTPENYNAAQVAWPGFSS